MAKMNCLLAISIIAGSFVLGSAVAAMDLGYPIATAIDGSHFPSPDDAGKVVIVNFWATWCAPCRAEMPALDAYYERHRVDGIALLAINVDAGASTKKLRSVAAAYSFKVARLDDAKMPRSSIPTALPDTRVYERTGILRYDSASIKGQPVIDEATLERVVTPLLAAGPTTPEVYNRY